MYEYITVFHLHWGCFQIWADIVNISIFICLIILILVFLLLGRSILFATYLTLKLVGHGVGVFLILLELPSTFTKWVYCYESPTSSISAILMNM